MEWKLTPASSSLNASSSSIDHVSEFTFVINSETPYDGLDRAKVQWSCDFLRPSSTDWNVWRLARRCGRCSWNPTGAALLGNCCESQNNAPSLKFALLLAEGSYQDLAMQLNSQRRTSVPNLVSFWREPAWILRQRMLLKSLDEISLNTFRSLCMWASVWRLIGNEVLLALISQLLSRSILRI